MQARKLAITSLMCVVKELTWKMIAVGHRAKNVTKMISMPKTDALIDAYKQVNWPIKLVSAITISVKVQPIRHRPQILDRH